MGPGLKGREEQRGRGTREEADGRRQGSYKLAGLAELEVIGLCVFVWQRTGRAHATDGMEAATEGEEGARVMRTRGAETERRGPCN